MSKPRVLITGAGGFIGSHLAEYCVEKGYQVRAFLHYNSRNHLGWLEDSPHREQIEMVSGDVRDFDSVDAAAHGVEIIFHLAALIGIPYSYISPLAYVRTNIEGTYNVLETAKRRQIKDILVTSTSETYGTAQYVPIDEKHPSVGQSPYSATKIGADQLALSYHKSFGIPVKVVRPFNVYGPRQSARAIIPTIITRILSGEKALRLGNTTPTRDLTFVSDTVAGFLEIAQSEKCVGETTNIGTGEEISILELANLIAQLLKQNVDIEIDEQRVRPAQSEVERLLCDNTKIRRQTSWQPRVKLKDGLQKTIEWCKKNINHYKPKQYNV